MFLSFFKVTDETTHLHYIYGTLTKKVNINQCNEITHLSYNYVTHKKSKYTVHRIISHGTGSSKINIHPYLFNSIFSSLFKDTTFL